LRPAPGGQFSTGLDNATYIADENRCVVEFEVDHPEHGIMPIVDVFTFDEDGRITRLAVYRC
jgi:hypothetical protein